MGLGFGVTPGGGIADQFLSTARVLNKGTRASEVGKGLGEMLGGAWLTLGGIGGGLVGTGLSTTGVGALLGVPAMAVSAGLVTSGVGNMAAGIRGLSQALMMEGRGEKTAAMGGSGAGRGGHKLNPDTTAEGPHSTFKTDSFGRVTGHAEWKPNTKNPSGFDQAKRVDTQYAHPHNDRGVPTPHTHDKSIPGGVRPATSDELPR